MAEAGKEAFEYFVRFCRFPVEGRVFRPAVLESERHHPQPFSPPRPTQIVVAGPFCFSVDPGPLCILWGWRRSTDFEFFRCWGFGLLDEGEYLVLREIPPWPRQEKRQNHRR